MSTTELLSLLETFRATHRTQEVSVGDALWRYRDSDDSGAVVRQRGDALVLVAGQGATCDIWFQLASTIGPNRRVISVGCPAGADDARAVVDGLDAVVAHARVERFALLGHSQAASERALTSRDTAGASSA